MTNSNTTTLAAGCLGLVMVASPSVAAEWYAGAGVGQTDVPGFSLSDLDDGSLTSGSVDGTDTGWTLYGGVRLNKYLGLEADYIDLGTFRIDAVSDGTGTDFAAGPVTAAASADGFSLSALGLIPVSDNFDLFARAGYFDIDVDTTVTDSTGLVGDGTSDDGFVYGIGAQYNFRAPFTLRLEWNRYDAIEEVDFIRIAGQFRFGSN